MLRALWSVPMSLAIIAALSGCPGPPGYGMGFNLSNPQPCEGETVTLSGDETRGYVTLYAMPAIDGDPTRPPVLLGHTQADLGGNWSFRFEIKSEWIRRPGGGEGFISFQVIKQDGLTRGYLNFPVNISKNCPSGSPAPMASPAAKSSVPGFARQAEVNTRRARSKSHG